MSNSFVPQAMPAIPRLRCAVFSIQCTTDRVRSTKSSFIDTTSTPICAPRENYSKSSKDITSHPAFFFRLSTLDIGLMREIEEYGSEASYHYEELATFAKENKIKDPAAIHRRLPEIRDKFAMNFRRIEQGLGKKMRTVASHGDFANRRLKVNNTEILKDPQLRQRCGIECESYDAALMENVDIYISDRPYPEYYHPISPMNAIGRHRRIYLLTHPRQCETNWGENTRDNLFRFYEGLTW